MEIYGVIREPPLPRPFKPLAELDTYSACAKAFGLYQ